VGSSGTALLILNFCCRWKTVVNFKPGRPIPVKKRRCQLKRRLGGPQSWYGHISEDKNLLPLQGFKTGSSTPKLFTLLTFPACLREHLVILIYTACLSVSMGNRGKPRMYCSLLAYCTARFGRSNFGHQMPPRLPTRSAL
jgi:hypothetical protein